MVWGEREKQRSSRSLSVIWEARRAARCYSPDGIASKDHRKGKRLRAIRLIQSFSKERITDNVQ